MADPKTTFRDIAERCLSGLTVERIAAELSLGVEEARAAVERVESVRLLLSHSFPQDLIARAARLQPWEVETIILATRERRQTGAARSQSALRDLPANERTDEALGVLDFWTSKWE